VRARAVLLVAVLLDVSGSLQCACASASVSPRAIVRRMIPAAK
jgi:hypothetical protein